MKEAAAEGVYLRMLQAVGARAGDIGPGIIAAHWPFVGSDSSGLWWSWAMHPRSGT